MGKSKRLLLLVVFTFWIVSLIPLDVSVSATPAQNSAVLHYDMETMFNATALDDLSPNTNYGEVGNATSATGLFGQGLEFEDYVTPVNATADPSLDGMSALTLLAWVYPHTMSGTGNMIIRKQNSYWMDLEGGTQNGVDLFLYNATTYVQIETRGTMSTNTWTHIAAVYNGTHAFFYINAVLDSNSIGYLGGSVRNTTTPFYVGNDEFLSGRAFDGVIDDVYVFDTALTQTQVQNVMNKHVFHGVYDEDTGLLESAGERAVNVTAYFSDGTTTETFEVNGTYEYGSLGTILYFSFNLTNERQYWVGENDRGDVYIFDASTTVYTISFLDLAGALDDYPFVEAQRYVNGSLMTVEKRRVDEEKKITMSLINGEKYNLIIRDGSSYTYGDLLMTSTTTVQLTLKGIEFPKETLLVYRYVRIYGIRTLGASGTGNITITYQDTLTLTNEVEIIINYRNGTLAYNATETADSFSHVWTSALNNTDYAVVVNINHTQYGVYTWRQYFPRSFSAPPWGLGFLGSLPFNTNIIVPSLLIIFVAGCFSVINAEVGAFMAVVTAAILTYLGWIPIAPGYLITAFSLATFMGIIYAKRRVQT